jgi:hypothetical protein
VYQENEAPRTAARLVLRWFSAAAGTLAAAIIAGVIVLAGRRLLVPRVRATTSPVDHVTLVLLLVIIVTGIVPTLFVNLFGHGYDYRTTVAPWFRGLFSGSPDVTAIASAPVVYQVHAASAWLIWALWPFGWCTPGARPSGTCGDRTLSTAVGVWRHAKREDDSPDVHGTACPVHVLGLRRRVGGSGRGLPHPAGPWPAGLTAVQSGGLHSVRESRSCVYGGTGAIAVEPLAGDDPARKRCCC